MKKNNWILLFLLGMGFSFFACSGSDPEVKGPDTPTVPETPKETITCSTTSLNATSEGGEYALEFTASSNWNITVPTNTTWCAVSPTSGAAGTTKVTVKTIANNDYDDRNATIFIKCGTATHSVVLTQKQKNALLLSATKYEVEQKGGTIEVEAKANVSYDVAIAESCKSWITSNDARALNSKKHSFTVAVSEEYDKREGEIVFKSADFTETVKVYQSGGAVFILSKDEYNVPKTGGEITIEVKSNFEFTVDEPQVEWLTKQTAGRAVSSHTLYYTVKPNETDSDRETSLVFRDKSSGTEKAVVKVVQGSTLLQDYPTPDRSKIAAFPGAEGAGKYVTGGAGGSVYVVTSLADDGSEGTLRWAVNKKGKRTIVFAVAGIIDLKTDLKISNGDVTIAGQTAPGDGICLKRGSVVVSSDNVIVRFLRFRLGDEMRSTDSNDQKDADAIWGRNLKNVMIDHCSMSWSTDECASFYGNTHFTMQWCILAESLYASKHPKGNHGYAGIWGGAPATFHHNLLAHHTSRTPRLCGSRYTGKPEEEKVDLRNNVFYNWGPTNGGYAGEGGYYNFVNNYYKPGKSTNTKKNIINRIFSPNGDDGSEANAKGVWGHFYLNGNVFDSNPSEVDSKYQDLITSVNNDNWVGLQPKPSDEVPLPAGGEMSLRLSSEVSFDSFDVKAYTQSAKEAYSSVLKYAGASLKRDAVDVRVVSEVENGTPSSKGGKNGIIDSQTQVGGWPTYTGTALSDADKDGMPDEWETQKGLNPNDASDAVKYNLSPDYTNLEVYINGLVSETFPSK